MPESREQALERLLRSLMLQPHCYDDTFDEPPEERQASVNLNELHGVAQEMDALGIPKPPLHASWAAMWPDQGGDEDEEESEDA